jgi:hypothetical protein
MKFKSFKLLRAISILVFLLFIQSFLPLSANLGVRTASFPFQLSLRSLYSFLRLGLDRNPAPKGVDFFQTSATQFSALNRWRYTPVAKIGLIKIYKKKVGDYETLYSPQVKIVQELETCYIAQVNSEFAPRLSRAGFKFEYLDDDLQDKKYYLVYCPPPFDLNILRFYGNAKEIEESISLFWSDEKNVREILPAQLEIVALPDEPLYYFKQKALTSIQAVRPEAELPLKFEIDPVILDIVSQVSKDNLRGYIQSLQDFQTRYASTPNCTQAGNFIYNFFVSLGIEAEQESFNFLSVYSSKNIVGTLSGKVDPSQVIIICAHYDSYSGQPLFLAPGADDNASGCAAVMEAARIFKDHDFDFSVKFICFSAEEWGLFGSKDYAQKARSSGEDIIAVINLDMIAYTDFLPEDLDIIGNIASEWLIDRFSSTAKTYTLLDILKIVNPSFVRSDHAPFWNSGYSAICGIEDADVPNPYYHTPQDTISTLNLDFATEAVKASLATAAELAQPVSTPQTPAGLISQSQVVSSLFLSRKTVFLSWNDNQDPVIGYNIYRTTIPHLNYEKVNSSPLAQTSYIDSNLDADTSYFYVITAVDSLGNESNFSKEIGDNEGNSSANKKIAIRKDSRSSVQSTRKQS